jgi:hypothetical protein
LIGTNALWFLTVIWYPRLHAEFKAGRGGNLAGHITRWRDPGDEPVP